MTDYLQFSRCYSVALVLAFLFLGGPSEARAQAAGIKVSETELIPTIRLEYFADQNVFRESSNENEATGVKIKPKLDWTADSGVTELKASYSGIFSTSGIESTDFDDHSLIFSGKTEFSKRSRLNGSFSFSRITEKLGTDLSIGAGENVDLNVFNRLTFNIGHTYGAQGARGNISTGLRVQDVAYQGNAAETRSSNYFEVSPFAQFSYRLAGSTRGFVEVRYRILDYDSDAADRDQLNLFLGAKWAESERFGASAKLGVLSFTYPNDAARDGEDLGIEVGGYYRPVSYSRFDLALTRSVYDLNDSVSVGTNATAIRDNLNLAWKFSWSSRLSHRAIFEYNVVERENCADDQSTIDTALELALSVRRWVTVGAGASIESRKFDGCDAAATGNNLDYTKEMFNLFISLSL